MRPARAWRASSTPAARSRSRPAPGGAAWSVLEHDAVGGERRADAVGLGEVPRLLRGRALGDHRLDARRVVAAVAVQELLRVALQQAERRAEPAQLARER